MPDISTVHFDVPLTNVSLAYRNAAYIAPIIAPEVIVRKQSDRYFIYDPERESFRSSNDSRAPGAEANEVDFALSSDSYFCDDHALVSAIPDEERDNADQPLRPEVDRVEFLTDKILLNHEINLATTLRNLSNIPGIDLDAEETQWDGGGGDPFETIDNARNVITDATQVVPNTLVLPFSVYTELRAHPAILQRVAGTAPAVVGLRMLAEILEVERILIPRAVKNTAASGQPPAMEPIWGKDVLLLAVNDRPGLKSVTPVLTFCWAAANSSRGTSVQSWREERRKSTMVRVQKYYDHKVVAAPAAYLIKNAIA